MICMNYEALLYSHTAVAVSSAPPGVQTSLAAVNLRGRTRVCVLRSVSVNTGGFAEQDADGERG